MQLVETAADALPRLQEMTLEELRAELARCVRATAESLVYLAAIWAELESRGEDLSALRTGLSAYLPLIASGRADPAAVVAFAGQPTLLRAIVQLPIAEQQRLAAGGMVPVVVQTPEGVEAEREIAPTMLSAAEVRRVFAPGVVRSPAEQSQILRLSRGRSRRPAPPPPINARAAAGVEPPPLPAETKQVVVPLAPSEHEALKITAARLDIPVSTLVRRLILMSLEP